MRGVCREMTNSFGIPLCSENALGILFVGLKLAHVIDWSWIWVTAPFWWLGLNVLLTIAMKRRGP